ncbi:MAG: CCA tRNA nucleotidyltransferase [Leptospiraceae bacterium]|nr:CCA tRNA nucleotidyltransferase [Leptospiraceae bacterium]MCP5498619.1 CCA tRNA nucleotidyltransferase [Leptospiraceae bacterium]
MIESIRDAIILIPPKNLEDLQFISRTLNEAGYKCYLVGGSVRDLAIGKVPYEYDLTTSAKPEDVKKIFRKVVDTGIKHGTVTVIVNGEGYEVTTFRLDIGYSDGRRPDAIIYGETLSDDLKRRDFTMNALALDLLTEEFVDEHNGLEDIQNKIIRTIGIPEERFTEDGLRPIRALRFISTLGFSIEEATYRAIYKTRSITAKISVERFHDELNKILKVEKSSLSIRELIKNEIFPLFTGVALNIQADERLFDLLDSANTEIPGIKLSILLHIILGENAFDLSISESLLKDLRYSKKNLKDCIFFLDRWRNLKELHTEEDTRRFLNHFISYTGKEKHIEYVTSFQLTFYGKNSREESLIKEVIAQNPPLSVKDLQINGNEVVQLLPLLEKRKIGDTLNSCMDYVLKNPEKNTKESLRDFLLQNYLYI